MQSTADWAKQYSGLVVFPDASMVLNEIRNVRFPKNFLTMESISASASFQLGKLIFCECFERVALWSHRHSQTASSMAGHE